MTARRRSVFIIAVLAVVAAVGGGGAVWHAVTTAAEPDAAGWHSLFDGLALGGWKSTKFGGEGEVTVADKSLRIARGADLSGVTWSEKFPRQNFELSLCLLYTSPSPRDRG